MKAKKDVTKGARSTQCELSFDYSMTREIDNIHERMRIRDYLIGKFSKHRMGWKEKKDISVLWENIALLKRLLRKSFSKLYAEHGKVYSR